jgi:hypothetical protein
LKIKQNLVAHCEKGTSDKIYLACIRILDDGTFKVIGKWGRRGRSYLQEAVKLTTPNESSAIVEQRRLFSSKLKGGYVNIESPGYKGPVTMNSPEVQYHLERGGKSVSSLPPVPLRSGISAPGDEVIVECVSNLGMEDKFDAGIEYVGYRHTDSTLLWVYDKRGEKQECFAERFKEATGA